MALLLGASVVSKRENADFASHNFADDSETVQHQIHNPPQLYNQRANMSFGKLYTYDVSMLIHRMLASVSG